MIDSKGPPHPWAQSYRIFPREHALWDAETEGLRQTGRICGAVDGNRECVGVKGHVEGWHIWEQLKRKEIEA